MMPQDYGKWTKIVQYVPADYGVGSSCWVVDTVTWQLGWGVTDAADVYCYYYKDGGLAS